MGDLESLQVFARLYFEGVLVESVLPAPAGAGALLDAPPVWQRSERTARLSVPPDNERALREAYDRQDPKRQLLERAVEFDRTDEEAAEEIIEWITTDQVAHVHSPFG